MSENQCTKCGSTHIEPIGEIDGNEMWICHKCGTTFSDTGMRMAKSWKLH